MLGWPVQDGGKVMIVRYLLQPGVRMEKLMDADGNAGGLSILWAVEPERKQAPEKKPGVPVEKQIH